MGENSEGVIVKWIVRFRLDIPQNLKSKLCQRCLIIGWN